MLNQFLAGGKMKNTKSENFPKNAEK